MFRPVMRPTRILALTGISVSLLGTAVADIETSIGAGYTSEYVFRGTNNGDDLFDLSLDVSGDGSLGGFGDLSWSAGLWLASFDGAANTNELNIYGEVSKSLSDMWYGMEEEREKMKNDPKKDMVSVNLTIPEIFNLGFVHPSQKYKQR